MTVPTATVHGVSVAHQRASVEDLEAAAFADERSGVEGLLEAGADEAYVLQTCNRVEAFVVGDPDALGTVTDDVPDSAVAHMDHRESLDHLLRVAAGLESVVLGEDHVLGQVRDAYEESRAVGGIGPVLEDAVTKAMRVGERARSETAINEGVHSLAAAAVRMASEDCALDGETGLVVGAGEMGRRAAKALGSDLSELLVANRTIPHAEHAADLADVETEALALDAAADAVADARVVVTATDSPDHVLTAREFADAGETYVLDLAQPRDVAPDAADVEGVALQDLDDLEAVTERTRERRRDAAAAVEAIVAEELERLLTQFKRKRADRVISAMYESAEHVKTSELAAATDAADFDADQREVLESMADAIVSQLLAAPTRSLRDAAEADDWETISTALELFDPEFEPDPPVGEDAGPEEIPESVRDRMPAHVRDQLGDD